MRSFIYGKHPAFGDFLAHGLPHEVASRLDDWLQSVLPTIKSALGEDWEAAWAAAPPLFTWIGPSVIGLPLTGVFLASQDKVGRRYPLIIGFAGQSLPPPMHPAHDAAPYIGLLEHVQGISLPEGHAKGASDLLAGYEMPELQGAPWSIGEHPTLWAQRADGHLGQLFEDARSVDAQQAQLSRSHWWQQDLPEREAGWLGANGLPNAEGLQWLLTGRQRVMAANSASAPDPEAAPEAEHG